MPMLSHFVILWREIVYSRGCVFVLFALAVFQMSLFFLILLRSINLSILPVRLSLYCNDSFAVRTCLSYCYPLSDTIIVEAMTTIQRDFICAYIVCCGFNLFLAFSAFNFLKRKSWKFYPRPWHMVHLK